MDSADSTRKVASHHKSVMGTDHIIGDGHRQRELLPLLHNNLHVHLTQGPYRVKGNCSSLVLGRVERFCSETLD